MKKIRITSEGTPIGTVIEIDGTKIAHVRKLELTHEAGGVPVLRLEIFALAGIEIECRGEVVKEIVQADTTTVDQSHPFRTSKPV